MTTGTPGPGRDQPSEVMSAARREVERMAHTIASDVAKLENKTIRALLPSLLQARAELQRDLSAWLNKKDGAAKFTAQELRRGLVAIESALETMRQMGPDLQAQIGAASHASATLASGHLRDELARFGAIFGESIRPTQISTAAIIAKTKHEIIPRIRTSSARYVQAVREDMRRQMQIGLARGETFTQLTNRLRRLGGPTGLVALKGVAGEPGSHVEDIAEGLFNRYRHWAERVVRTEVINAYNVEHIAAIDLANDDRDEDDDEVLQLRWDSSPDRRRCPLCASLDGELAPIGKPFRGGYDHPPAHPNCRCVALAWLARWGSIKGELGPAHEPKRPHKKIHRLAPVGPVTVKAPRKPKPKPPIRTDERAALAAMARDDLSGARQNIEETFRKLGLAPHATTTAAAQTSVSKLPAGVLGLHRWDGHIMVAPSAAKHAREFAEEFLKDPAGSKKMLKALQKERERTKLSRPPGHDAALALADKGSQGYEVLVHEASHGFGPVMSTQYRGAGAKVEEITTETVARQYMREKFGLSIKAIRDGTKYSGGGAYEGMIQNAIDTIRERFRVGEPAAHKILEAASVDFRQQHQASSLATSLSPIEHFAKSIAKVRPSKKADENTPRRALVRTDGTLATTHEYKIGTLLLRKLTP